MGVIDIGATVPRRKLRVPGTPPGCLLRARLHAILDEVADKRAICICAPAGYGKTMLAARWARNAPLPCCWMSLDEDDTNPSLLAASLVTALDNVTDSECGSRLAESEPWHSSAEFATALCAALDDLERQEALCALVIDNCQCLQAGSGSADIISKLLHYAPDWLRFVLIGRSIDFPALSELRLSGELVDIDIDLLRATAKEQARFWQKTPGANEVLPDLGEWTGGWFAAMSMLRDAWVAESGSSEGSVDARSPKDGLSFPVSPAAAERLRSYIEKSFLDGYDADLRMLAAAAASIGPFCTDMLQHAAQIPFEQVSQGIDRLLEDGVVAICRFDGGERWIACSGVCADFCLQLADRSHIAEWRQRASEWCEHEGMYDHSVELAIQNGDWDYVESLSWSRFTQLFRASDFDVLWNWVSKVPASHVLARPRVALMTVQGAARRRDLALMNSSVDIVLGTLKEDIPDHYHGLAKTICASARAVSAERAEARRLVQEAFDLLEDDDVYLKGIAEQIIAESYMESDIVKMDRGLQRIFDRGEWRSDAYFGGSLLSTMTMVDAMLGRLGGRPEIDRALDGCGARDNPGLPLFIRMHLGRAARAYHLGDARTAANILETCKDAVTANGIEIDLAFLCGLASMVAFDAGDVEGARAAFFQGLGESALFTSFAYPSISQINLIIPLGSALPPALAGASENDQPALRRLKAAAEHAAYGRVPSVPDCPTVARSVPEERPMERFQWCLLAAILEEEAGRRASADDLMREALSLAEAEGYEKAARDDALLALPIIKRVADPACAWQASLLKTAPEREHRGQPVQPLTAREREVAALLASDLSYTEMAERLFIADGTLRKHVKRIFAKLGVHTRAQATARLARFNNHA